MGSTRKELIEDLWQKPHTLKRQYILARAKADFDSDLAGPKMQLVDDLRQAGFEDLAQKTIDGAYDDEKPSAEQIEEMRRELGPEMFDAIFGRKGRGDG